MIPKPGRLDRGRVRVRRGIFIKMEERAAL
jgi:hypothetical protein